MGGTIFVRLALSASLAVALAATYAHAKENAGASGAAAPVAPTTPLHPPGTCLSYGDCANKCAQHADVHTTTGGASPSIVTRCKSACETQPLPGHPGQFMTDCVKRGGEDMKCVESLIKLNICLFQAAANPIKSAKCTAAAIPGCR